MSLRRRPLLGIVAALLATAACGQPHQDSSDVRNAMARTDGSPHEYRYSDVSAGRTVEVAVKVQDSFRSLATLSLNGTPLLDEALVDDGIAIKLLAPDQWNPGAKTPLGPLLAKGKWVYDPAGAPKVLGGADQQNLTITGRDEILDALSAFTYVRSVMAQASKVQRFNKDDLSYRPSEDPFRGLVDGDIRSGILRYDAVPPALPRSPNTQQGNRLPDARFFRNLSVYIKAGRIVRVLERVDFEDQVDMLKAKKQAKPKFLLDELNSLRQGLGDNPVRQRSMSIDITPNAADVTVAVPSDVIKANLGSLIQSGAMARLPGQPVAAAGPALPVLPTPAA